MGKVNCECLACYLALLATGWNRPHHWPTMDCPLIMHYSPGCLAVTKYIKQPGSSHLYALRDDFLSCPPCSKLLEIFTPQRSRHSFLSSRSLLYVYIGVILRSLAHSLWRYLVYIYCLDFFCLSILCGRRWHTTIRCANVGEASVGLSFSSYSPTDVPRDFSFLSWRSPPWDRWRPSSPLNRRQLRCVSPRIGRVLTKIRS
jgi:hypothetical protein